MTKPCKCEVLKKDGSLCWMPAFAKVHRQWMCKVHAEHAIARANKVRDLLYAPRQTEDADQR